jgi:epoxide hydrolase 4
MARSSRCLPTSLSLSQRPPGSLEDLDPRLAEKPPEENEEEDTEAAAATQLLRAPPRHETPQQLAHRKTPLAHGSCRRRRVSCVENAGFVVASTHDACHENGEVGIDPVRSGARRLCPIAMGDPNAAPAPGPTFDVPGVATRYVELPEVRLHVAEAGPPDGSPVVLLHGFPEFWWGWRRQLPVLADAGFRVIAPDQRGYHLSSKPRTLSAYCLDRLAEDLIALLDAHGMEHGRVVGHDWGGAVAWWAALRFPERIERLAILNCPHPAVMRRALLRDWEQRRRSGYMLYFQLPWLPERKLAASGYRGLTAVFRRSSRRGTFTERELDRYAAAAAVPGALTGMLAWYRAALRRPPRRLASSRVEPRTLLLWGLEDVALGPALVDASAQRCRQVDVVRIPDAGHWVQHEAAEEVNARLIEFLALGS